MIDFRSDTVTRPTPAMREAMAQAEVGDDVFGDDPTINLLQEELAATFGKARALFVPSGTMANQVMLLARTRPGDHVIVPTGGHLFHDETGGAGALAGVQLHQLGQRGRYDLDELRGAVRANDHHYPPTTLVTLENTHNESGGRIVPLDHIAAVRDLTGELGLPLHLDGARVFNAIVEGTDPLALGQLVDSLSICLSKGLGAPVGSVLIGDEAFITRCHRYRKMVGGGMRQGGILAAAGRYALAHHVELLADDHRRARTMAQSLATLPGVEIDGEVETNLLYFRLTPAAALSADAFVEAAAEHDVLCFAMGDRVRWVTHLEIDESDVSEALRVAKLLLAS